MTSEILHVIQKVFIRNVFLRLYEKSKFCVCFEVHISVEGHCSRMQMERKIQQTMSVWICELQTPKLEHCCEIKIDHFFGLQTSGTSHDLSDNQTN